MESNQQFRHIGYRTAFCCKGHLRIHEGQMNNKNSIKRCASVKSAMLIAVIERIEIVVSFVTSSSISYATPPTKIRRLGGGGSQNILPNLNITDNEYCYCYAHRRVSNTTNIYTIAHISFQLFINI